MKINYETLTLIHCIITLFIAVATISIWVLNLVWEIFTIHSITTTTLINFCIVISMVFLSSIMIEILQEIRKETLIRNKLEMRRKLERHAECIIEHFDTIAPMLKNFYGYECSYMNRKFSKELTITKTDNHKIILTYEVEGYSCKPFLYEKSLDYDENGIKPLIHALKDITMTL